MLESSLPVPTTTVTTSLDTTNENFINIPDITPQAFGYLIKYINGLNPTMLIENAVDILYMAKKYMITPIEKESIHLLEITFQKMISIDTILTCLIRLHAVGLKVS